MRLLLGCVNNDVRVLFGCIHFFTLPMVMDRSCSVKPVSDR